MAPRITKGPSAPKPPKPIGKLKGMPRTTKPPIPKPGTGGIVWRPGMGMPIDGPGRPGRGGRRGGPGEVITLPGTGIPGRRYIGIPWGQPAYPGGPRPMTARPNNRGRRG